MRNFSEVIAINLEKPNKVMKDEKTSFEGLKTMFTTIHVVCCLNFVF